MDRDHLLRLIKATVCVASLAAYPVLAQAADDGNAVVVQLGAMANSGETGTATMRRSGSKTVVELTMTGSTGIQPAHFHTGTCEKYGPRPLYPLTSIVRGHSLTTLDVPFDRLTSGDLVINVHKSFDEIATIVSCAVAKRP